MPGSRTRLVAGMAALACALALQACSSLPSPPAAATSDPPFAPSSPSSPVATGAPVGGVPWSEALDFSGDLSGHMSTVVPNDATRRSECTGKHSKVSGSWASTLYGVAGAGSIYGVIFAASGYRGPGVYREGATTVQVHAIDGSRDWQSRAGDAVTLTVANDEESGTVDAVLTNLADGKSKLHLTGSWSCRTA